MSGFVIRRCERTIYERKGVRHANLGPFGETWEVGPRFKAHVFPTRKAAFAELHRRGEPNHFVLSLDVADRDEAAYILPDGVLPSGLTPEQPAKVGAE